MNGYQRGGLVTAGIPSIGEGFSHLRHKLPFIASLVEHQFKNSKRIIISHFAPSLDGTELGMVCSTSPDNERANPVDLIDPTISIQGREPFIVMIVPGEYKINSRSVELLYAMPRCRSCNSLDRAILLLLQSTYNILPRALHGSPCSDG